jgi:hypothetical protein
MNLFSAKPKTENAASIKEWTRKVLNLDDETIVMVSELQCRESDCPPVETVIAVMRTGAEKRMFKIHRAIDELTEKEVIDAIKNGHRH